MQANGPVVIKWKFNRLIGPFPSARDAAVWAESNLRGELWTYINLVAPEDIALLRDTEEEVRAMKMRIGGL